MKLISETPSFGKEENQNKNYIFDECFTNTHFAKSIVQWAGGFAQIPVSDVGFRQSSRQCKANGFFKNPDANHYIFEFTSDYGELYTYTIELDGTESAIEKSAVEKFVAQQRDELTARLLSLS